MSVGAQKFRPYFTAQELMEIIVCLKERPTPARLALVTYLDNFAMKIDRGTILPQHTIKGTINEQLVVAMGLSDVPAMGKESDGDVYKRWLANPNSCSPVEIQRVMMYRFQNDLMSEDEESMYLAHSGVNY